MNENELIYYILHTHPVLQNYCKTEEVCEWTGGTIVNVIKCQDDKEWVAAMINHEAKYIIFFTSYGETMMRSVSALKQDFESDGGWKRFLSEHEPEKNKVKMAKMAIERIREGEKRAIHFDAIDAVIANINNQLAALELKEKEKETESPEEPKVDETQKE